MLSLSRKNAGFYDGRIGNLNRDFDRANMFVFPNHCLTLFANPVEITLRRQW